MVLTQYVSETPGVNGGYPVLAGTRIPVRCLLDYYQLYGGDIRRIQQTFPYLSLERIQGALDYYAAYPERVDEDYRRNREAWEQYSGLPWPG